MRHYPHLLSPLKIGNVVLKNRLIASPSRPHYIQGPEPYPTDPLITHYARKAENGASLVVCNSRSPMPLDYGVDPFEVPDIRQKFVKWPQMGANHEQGLDPRVGKNQHYFSQLAEAIRYYGSKASVFLVPDFPAGYDCSEGVQSVAVEGDTSESVTGKEITEKLMEEVCGSYAEQALLMKHLGFEAVFLHMCYRGMLPSRFLSPLTNKRKDQYGGSLENRARFPLMICDRIREACGPDFLIEAAISGEDPGSGGWTLQDTVDFAKLAEGRIDLLQLRSGEIDPNHPTGFNPKRTPFLYMAEAVKQSGADIRVVTLSGYQDLELCEDVIASGKADMIAAARAFISNPDFGRKAYEGRNDDVVPCLRCNKCHRSSDADPWVSSCSVNPIWGIEHKVERYVRPPEGKKRIAVVGGGPAGMEAAFIARQRGHEVTLYEKSDRLGGQMKAAGTADFKWPLKEFSDYLIYQMGKQGVKLALGAAPSKEELDKEKYDVVVAAVGAKPLMPRIPGIDAANVMSAIDVYGNEDRVKGRVAVIGGGEVGVETGMHLAAKGHETLVLEMTDRLAADTTPIHYRSMFEEAWKKQKGFDYRLNARCTEIGGGEVVYEDESGKTQRVEADTVVIAAGMSPLADEALKYAEAGERFFMIGDCNGVGNIQRAMRSAFATMSQI